VKTPIPGINPAKTPNKIPLRNKVTSIVPYYTTILC
jgi:hypothetical protein